MRNPLTKQPFAPRLQIPDIFGQALSYEDQILTLIHWVTSTLADVEYVSEDDLTALDAKLTAAIQAVAAESADDLARAVADLESQISGISEGSQIWDVTTGSYRENQTAMRATVNRLAVRGATIAEMIAIYQTCQALAGSGLTVAGVAVAIYAKQAGDTLSTRYEIKE